MEIFLTLLSIRDIFQQQHINGDYTTLSSYYTLHTYIVFPPLLLQIASRVPPAMMNSRGRVARAPSHGAAPWNAAASVRRDAAGRRRSLGRVWTPSDPLPSLCHLSSSR